ncbi:Rab3 GTPase-activating protein regulatory subunit [Aphelenchoides bicaudatus]|nr:Rab3 GTPase-activating protein regulatory subunit [Aphelenchoides bicaudatus]
MFCTLGSVSKIRTEDLHLINGLLGRDAEEQKKVIEEAEPVKSKQRRTFDSEGLLEPDANPLTSDEDSEPETANQQWPAWESTSEAESQKIDEINDSAKWLKKCLIAVSPSMEFVALAEVQHLVILEKSTKHANQMEMADNIKIETDYITAIYILPLGSTRKTEASQIDWTCIVVALSSGWLNFYTERGVLIFREHVSHEPIRALRFGQSFFPGNQELTALSSNCLYVMEGLSLFTVLKSARNEVARGERALDDICNDLPITAHCIQLANLRKASDFNLLGIEKPPLFDQYAAASQQRLPLRTLAQSSSHIYCSTTMSFATFLLFDSEQINRNLLTDTIHNYANRISAAIPSIGFRSFFGLGQSRRDRPQKTEVVDSNRIRINIQSRLVDPGRHCDRNFTAFGSWNLMVVCDEKARVLLIDTKSRAVLRVWKGYRNARCAFIESTENTTRKQRKKVLFLAIFAPRRGILEIWSLRSGPRVAVFNVDPKGRLLTIPLSHEGILLGQQATTTSTHHNASTAVFMEPNGTFKIINVPFHFAALANANRLHDENLLKESNLNNLINTKSSQFDYQPFIRAVQALKTVDCQKRLLERMIATTSTGKLNPNQAEEILASCLEAAKPELRPHLSGLRQITQIYIQIGRASAFEDTREGYDKLRDVLSMSVEEFDELNLDLLMKSNLETNTPHAMYLNEFREKFTFSDLECKNIVLSQQADHLKLALHMFPPFLLSTNEDVDQEFVRILNQLQVSTFEILDLFLIAWQNEWNKKPWVVVGNALKLVPTILSRFESDELSTATDKIEQSIYQSENPRAALFLLLTLRAIERQKNKRSQEDADQDEDQQMEWETLDDKTAWLLLAARHLSIMSLISEFKLETPLGLARLADKGYGFYREQIGQNIALAKINGQKLIALAKKARQFFVSTNDSEETSKEEDLTPTDPEFTYDEQLLISIFRQFPYSFAIELLLCDCAWECASRWYRSSENSANHSPQTRTIEHLELAIDYLSHISVVARLQHGISLMIWDTFIRLPFQNLVSFIFANEGRVPRDRALRKDVFVTEMELPRFMKCIRQLLRVLQSSVVDLDMMPSFDHKFEHFVEQFFENRRIKVKKNKHHTLTEVASIQRSINYHLVLHHIHLAICIELQLLHNLRVPLDLLFSDVAQRAFFADFHDHPLIPITDVDEKMELQRQNFMEDVVAAVGIPNNDQSYHDNWELINEITKDWQLDADLLRIKEITMLHEANFDKDAEKLYAAVQNRKLLASRLTPVAMGRFKALTENQEELKTRAAKKLKQTTWTAIRSLPDQFMPNFEPTNTETFALTKSVLYMFSFTTKPTKEHYQQLNANNEKRLLTELCEFLQANGDLQS